MHVVFFLVPMNQTNTYGSIPGSGSTPPPLPIMSGGWAHAISHSPDEEKNRGHVRYKRAHVNEPTTVAKMTWQNNSPEIPPILALIN